ncbi:baseplate multidomain protein megatron [Aureimonas leprariae]|uniref:Host specificity protein n=1 Tax=Plantimonas leprariae TaxID=2615207 RepID=A0A7V7PPM4_9HYPH|nr:glycoside hydrolase/phage tail family protein [Aureimonas leprariae]KAB0679940.1 hypothetical protein F6X38_10220 [Aureimonas leprariae]
MATILLQAAGGVFGTLIGGPVGGVVGRALGALGGAAIDSSLLSPQRRVEGPRLAAARIQEADEGAGVARLYGTARIAGQMIWTTRFEEEKDTERQGGKGGGGEQTVTTYSYFGNVAIGLCEGPIACIRRVWADGEELDLTAVSLRVHLGREDQMPDPLIEAKQGAGNAPGYRGLAYIVIERLPLEKWGNRIPQIACEVVRPVGDLERNIRAVTIIPGASEHGLDPSSVRERVRRGEDRLLNRNMLFGASDFEASIDELTALCPKLERAALVVAWFGDDLRAGSCTIRPGVEAGSRNESKPWRVGPTDRTGARLISESGGGPAYGGTPSDAGVLRAIADLRARGLKVTYYPFLLMDVPAGNNLPDPYGCAEQAAYPWRGRITLDREPGRAGSGDGTTAAADTVRRFVGAARVEHFAIGGGTVSYAGPAEWSYRRMVLHQAHLAKLAGGVDAFVIGSELRGLTRVRDAGGGFPFVAALAALAADVKLVLPRAKVIYAADWSEYFGYQPADGSDDVFFNLDPLWAHPAIDMVGIDNYLPIADWRDEDAGGEGLDAARSPYDRDALRRGIAGGENFDWYYASEADRAARRRTPIADGRGKPWVFRGKDLKGWWSNPHYERRGGVEVAAKSAWVPMSKPIWFTELGCAAIDKGANQPNVFLDPKSGESAKPYFSTGARDDLMQRRFLDAHLGFWDPAVEGFRDADNPLSPVFGGRMVDPAGIHLWAWDARPYPAFPGRADVWSDGANWRRGHWLTGRLGQAPLDGLIRTLLADHGFAAVDATQVDAVVAGYLVGTPGSARAQLEELLRLCGVVTHAEAGRLVFRSTASLETAASIEAFAETDEDQPFVEARRAEESETAEEVVVGFIDAARFYQPGAAGAVRPDAEFPRQDTIELPVALEEDDARRFAAGVLGAGLSGRETLRFALAPTELAVEPGDAVNVAGRPGRWLVTRIESGLARRVEARRLPGAVAFAGDGGVPTAPLPNKPEGASRPFVLLLDLPQGDAAVPEEAARIAGFVHPPKPLLVQASAAGGPFETRLVLDVPSTMGELRFGLAAGPVGVIDGANVLEVELYRGALYSIERERLLAGANLCAVQSRSGAWEVLQFESAEEIAPSRFRLRTLARGQGGTEDATVAGAEAGAAFVLLDAATQPLHLKTREIGRTLDWRVAVLGQPLDGEGVAREAAALGLRAVRPLSPVHLRCAFAPDGSATFGWVRRTRIAGDGWDGIDVPLGEEIERYRVTLSDGSGVELVRESDAASLIVSAGEQMQVFGRMPATLTARVAQLSLRHEAGTERSAVFGRPGA